MYTVMVKTLLTFLFLITLIAVQAQDARQYYDQGLQMAQQGKAEEAIRLFNKSIELNPGEYVAWYNRGITKMIAHLYEEALPDFDQAIRLSPGYKKAYINRGTARKHLTDYDGALADYNYALKIDSSNNSEVYYDRGLLYNLTGKRIPACLDFEKALKLGYKNAKTEMDKCIKRPTADTSIHSILRLSRTADNDQYGFTPEHPVKVGMGPESGPNNARTYLELLRDATGKPVKYELSGTCCPYESAHALFGKQTLLEKCQISYHTVDGTDKKSVIYISYYDYEEPLIPAGMKTVAVR
jgi:tetratricopeptide (TPR) repeat protein